MIGLVSAPGADTVLCLIPNTGKEHRRNIQIALGHGTIKVVVAIVQGMNDILGRGLFTAKLVVAPVVIVTDQYNLIGGVGLNVVRTGNHRHGVVFEGGNAAHVVVLAGLRPLD